MQPSQMSKCRSQSHNNLWKDSENLTFELHAWFKTSPCKREDFLQVAFELQSMEYFSKNKACMFSTAMLKHDGWHWSQPWRRFKRNEKCQRNIFLSISQNKQVLKRVLPITKDINKFNAIQKRKRHSCSDSLPDWCCHSIAKVSTTFHFEGPLIHILFKELKRLLKSILLRFIDPKILEGKSRAELAKSVVENQLSLDKIVVGKKTKRFLKKLFWHDAGRERIAMRITEETSLTR